jgi:glycerophosphoryl diester phosphodiesterase
MRKSRIALALLASFAAFAWLNNTSLLSPPPAGEPVLFAHRGVAQRFDPRGVGNDTCTAARMLPPSHGYLENTLPSIGASFAAGADWVEIDVHPTTDGQFAVFHDWTLDCRTEGRGRTRDHSMAELRRLDVGHGYTADGGRSFPFRGKGVGLLPSLDDVLSAFPRGRFVINVKSNDPQEGVLLAAALARLPQPRQRDIIVYGGEAPVAQVRSRLPQVRTASRVTLKACLLGHVTYGWTGVVPPACRNAMVLVPLNVAPWLWGWPSRMQGRFESAGAVVVVIGPYRGGFTTGVDTPAEWGRLPAGYSGGIWTDEIAALAAAFPKRH